jgi:hypothetical protein
MPFLQIPLKKPEPPLPVKRLPRIIPKAERKESSWRAPAGLSMSLDECITPATNKLTPAGDNQRPSRSSPLTRSAGKVGRQTRNGRPVTLRDANWRVCHSVKLAYSRARYTAYVRRCAGDSIDTPQRAYATALTAIKSPATLRKSAHVTWHSLCRGAIHPVLLAARISKRF